MGGKVIAGPTGAAVVRFLTSIQRLTFFVGYFVAKIQTFYTGIMFTVHRRASSRGPFPTVPISPLHTFCAGKGLLIQNIGLKGIGQAFLLPLPF